jgi:hypothetical protein
MKYEDIPEKQKRLCVSCSSLANSYETNYTEQKPIGVKYHPGTKGCWGPRAKIEWKWECLDCGTEQF